jgi:hypothetical protein
MLLGLVLVLGIVGCLALVAWKPWSIGLTATSLPPPAPDPPAPDPPPWARRKPEGAE